jgi:hypothetical protein
MYDMTKTKIKMDDFPDEEILGQYASDWALDPGNPKLVTEESDKTGTLGARGDGRASFHHGTVLFDEVDVTPDEATGIAHKEEGIEEELKKHGLAVGSLPTRRSVSRKDEAELWLAHHDPEYNQRIWH